MDFEKKKKIIALLKFLALVLVVVGIPFLIYKLVPTVSYYLNNVEEFDAMLMENAGKGIFIYIAAQILQVVIAIIPGEVVQIAGGYVYGVWGGVALSLIGITIGSFLAFRISRFLGRDAVCLFFKEKDVAKVEHYFQGKKGGATIFALFLIPGMPKDLLVYVAGLSGMNEKRFYILSMLGRIPALVGSMIMGTLLQDREFTTLIIFAAIVCVIFVVCVIFREKLFTLVDKIKDKVSNK